MFFPASHQEESRYDMNKSICAVIVTYNRKDLLLQCLQALENQTYPPNHIIIVNNASTDGTLELLQQQKWTDYPKITLLTLSNNQGGAGGFYEGTKLAYQKGFDYIWLMDDDGKPSKTCLEKLLPYCSENCYIGPMVLDPEIPNKISFALRLPSTLQVLDNYNEIPTAIKENNVINHVVLPFNGTLIARNLINDMGFINKDYFIWGDEKEYTMRAKRFNAQILTVVDAIFYHPSDSSVSTPMFFNKLRFNYTSSKLKQYCFYRNSIATYKQYHQLMHAVAFLGKTTWFFLFTKPSLSNLFFSWKAMRHGWVGDFTHHHKYL